MKYTDEQIIAAILGGAGRHSIRWGLGTFGEVNRTASHVAPCCAIGAGVLFAGLTINDQTAIDTFAKTYGVDRITAIGVSDGFEQGAGTAASLWEREKATPAYARGWAIGAAVRAAIESGNS